MAQLYESELSLARVRERTENVLTFSAQVPVGARRSNEIPMEGVARNDPSHILTESFCRVINEVAPITVTDLRARDSAT